MSAIEFGLAGRTALVAGGGGEAGEIGNGAAAAVMLARAGARVAVADLAFERASETCERIAAEGGVARPYACDVGVEEDCRRTLAAVAEELGAPRVLVNNVGVAGPPGSAEDVDLDRWDQGMRVNVKSMVMTSRFAIPLMTAAGGGAIVNVASVAGLSGGHPALLYTTSKGAVVQLTRAMAAQHGAAGIRVNCVAPGLVFTSMVRSRGLSEELRAARRESSLLGTEGTGWDVGAAILFLASGLAGWITGVVLPVDAGYSAAIPLPTPPRV